MFLKFTGATDLESWAQDYCLAVTATADEALVAGIGEYICQTQRRVAGGDPHPSLGFVSQQAGHRGR